MQQQSKTNWAMSSKRVVQILTFTEPLEWMFVSSQDMVADLRTCRVLGIQLG